MNAGLLRTVARHLRGHTEGVQPDADLLRRFARERDERAFEELIRRHGPLVWGVCRRALANRADAEDAFQATFLVLAKDPRAVRKPAALGCWLYGVARRVAHRMRGRAKSSPLSTEPAAADAADQLTVREFLSALDDELARLPDRVRGPLVLCFLQERTQDEAAKQLGVSLSTLKRRLDAGRETLRDRLVRRGVDLTAALAAAGIGGTTASASVVDATARAAVGGVVSAGAITIAEGVMRTMGHAKLKAWAAGLMMAATAVGGTGYVASAGGQGPGGEVPGSSAAQPGANAPTVGGQPGPVVQPKPAANAGADLTLLDLERRRDEAILAQTQKAIDAYSKQLQAMTAVRGGFSESERLGIVATIARLGKEAEEFKYRLEINRHLSKLTSDQTKPAAPQALDVKLFEIDLRQAEAELEAAKATFDLLTKQYDLIRKAGAPLVEANAAELAMTKARLEVHSAMLKIDAAKHKLTRAKEAAEQAAPARPAAPPKPADSPEVRKLREEMLKEANKYMQLIQQRELHEMPSMDDLRIQSTYRGSLRIMELDGLLAPANRLSAIRAHFVRMKELDTYNTARAQAGAARPQNAIEAKIYRLEAEVWVKEAEAAPNQPAPDPRGPGRPRSAPAGFRGTVREYDRESGIAMFTPGLDAGVERDTVLDVYRLTGGTGKYLGRLTVMSADPKQGGGTFVPANTQVAPGPDDLPKAGDELRAGS